MNADTTGGSPTAETPSPAFTVVVTHPRWHALKVEPPYFDAIFDGDKTFEVRKNDRAYQRGDHLRLREWHPAGSVEGCHTCDNAHWRPHYTDRECVRRVSFVYSGDPRFGGVEPGHVVLALANDGGEDA